MGKSAYHFVAMFRLVTLVCSAVLAACAVQASESQIGEIIGGQHADISEFPHMVAMLLDGSAMCGGSILSEKYILSAAHCTHPGDHKPERFTFRVGSTNRNQGGDVYEAEAIYPHPYYNRSVSNYDWDAVIIHVKGTIKMGPKVQPIRVPDSGVTYPVGTTGIASGWGSEKLFGAGSDVLQKVEIKVVEPKDCPWGRDNDRVFCAVDVGKGVCSGDSGGPLVDTSKKTQIGVVSAGGECGKEPAIFVILAHPDIRRFISHYTRNEI